VKFLVDNQLPAALARHLQTWGFDCQHVLEAGLDQASDAEICRHADAQERIIISKDEDFLYLASRPKSTIRLLWVRLGNCRTAALLAAFDGLRPMIEASLKAGDRIIEIR
jgi:predicted nuclease of predicted toxin-antitoxin system